MWLLSAVLSFFSFSLVYSFNLDTVNYVRHRGSSQSMFGFTVATHRERGNSWILVGAPNAQNEQPGVRNGGAVFRCTIDSDDSCQELPFDTKGHNVDTQGRYVDSKSGQWFGATLHSSGEDGPIVACAPRYVYYSNKLDRRDPVGTCWIAKNDFSTYSEYSPCRTAYFGYHRQGSCQAGFSAAISNDGRRLFVGGPGSWYWQGQMYSIDAHATFRFTPGKFGGAFGSGQVIQQSLETRPSVISTKGGSEKDDNSYMGYSTTVGDFTGEGVQGVAVGMPRGSNLLGKILLFTWNLTNHQNITGLQLGSYFGYALAAGDIDGDKTDDLIIGAPLHTEPNNEGKYEVGRVYIVYQGKDPTKRFRRVNLLDGFNSKSRFGLSVASLGDINLDGFADFAVGAPYDGPNENGAVYVYHGATNIAENKYAQVIYAEDIATPGLPVSTFGFSIGGGIDLDRNDYPDMAIGSYLSDMAYFFRSRPIVKVDTKVRFMAANKQIILDEKNCTLLNRQAVPCTSVDICMKFSGITVPDTINLDVQYVLDALKPKYPRMFFISNENRNILNQTITLQKDNREICTQKTVYIKNDIRDKLTPLEVEVRFSMRESQGFQQTRRNPRSILLPILDAKSAQVKKDSISIHKNCGQDNICIPNLRLIAEPNVQRYLLGSNKKLEFDIVVQNEGEDSFESTFDLQLPPGVDFNKIVQYDKTEIKTLCSSIDDNIIRCDIGNPLPAGKIARFKIIMTPYHKEGMKSSYDFILQVNSSNSERESDTLDNQIIMSIPIWVDSRLELGGTSKPTDVHYNTTLYTSEEIRKESDIGQQVIHLYTIKNNGPSSVMEAELVILWPNATLGGESLLYLLEQPHIMGNVKCELVPANTERYELEFRKKSIWEAMGINANKGNEHVNAGSAGIVIEEGESTYGTSFGIDKVASAKVNDFDYEQNASYIHQQRGKQQHKLGQDVSGTVVHVGEDTGKGSSVHVESSWSNKTEYGPTITHTYVRNTTRYIGPDGKVHYQTSYGHSGDGRGVGSGFSTSETQSHTSGSRQHGSSDSGYITGQHSSSGSSGTHTSYDSGLHRHMTSSSGVSYPQENYEGATAREESRTGGGHRVDSTVTATHQGSSSHYGQVSGGRTYEQEYRTQTQQQDNSGRTYTQENRDQVYGQNTRGRTQGQEDNIERHFDWSGRARTDSTRDDYYGEYDYRSRAREEAARNQNKSQTGHNRTSGGHSVSSHNEESYDTTYPKYPDNYDLPYSEEEYYGSTENKAYDETAVSQDNYNRDSSGVRSRHGGNYAAGGQQGSYNYNRSDHWSSGNQNNLRNTDFERDFGQHGLGAAAIDQGFKVGMIGLPEINSAAAGSSDHSSHVGNNAASQSSGSKWESRSESRWSSSSDPNHNYVGRDNVPTDKPDYTNRFHGRKKRQINTNEDVDIQNLKCNSTQCVIIRCTVGPLAKDQDAIIAIRSRVNVRALRNITTSQPIKISSKMLARISKLPYIGTPKEKEIYKQEIFTTVQADPDIKPYVYPLWVIVLSAVAGAIILLLVIFLLYKCGFFKRNRPSDAPERQPLNTNGYYNGDAAL